MSERIATIEQFLIDQAQQNQMFIKYMKETSQKLQEDITSLNIYYTEILQQNQFQKQNKKQCEYQIKHQNVNFKKINQGGYNYFICKLCNKCFVDQQNMLQHQEKTHSDPFQVLPCDVCGILFNGDLSLMNHQFKDHLKSMLKGKKQSEENDQP